MANGNGLILKAAIGFGVSAIVGVMGFMGNTVKEHDVVNIKEHKEIRSSISDFRVEQMRQGTILERIDDKL